MRYERGGSPAVVKKVCIILKTGHGISFSYTPGALVLQYFFSNFAEKVATWSRQRKVWTKSVIWLLWNKFPWISVEMYCRSIWQYYCCTNHTILHVVIAIKCLYSGGMRRSHKMALTPYSYSSLRYRKTFY